MTIGVFSGILLILRNQYQRKRNPMSDAHRRYRAIFQALTQLFNHPTGHRACHVQTLAAFICGILGSSHTHIPKIADHVPNDATLESSLVTRLSRWYQHDDITEETFFLPVLVPLLAALVVRLPVIELIMDGSAVGRNCVALVVSIVYCGRAIPIAWMVVKGRKGHLPQAIHRALLAEVHDRIPASAEQVVFLGDGEFDGTDVQEDIWSFGWDYVCRTAKNTVLWREGEKRHCADMEPAPDGAVTWPGVEMTGDRYGPVHAIAYWEATQEEAIYLVTSLCDAARAIRHYLKRPHIETFFSDQKSRGFHLDKSHLANPARLSRLMIAACLAYIWIIYLGRVAHRDGWVPRIHRRGRCDLSLFQLGLRFLRYLMKRALPIPVGFVLIDGDSP